MLTRPLLLIIFALLMQGCAHKPAPQAPLPIAPGCTKQIRSMPVFNQVLILGRMDVNLHTGYRQPQVVLHGDPRDLAQLTTLVKDNSLRVSLTPGYPKFGLVSVDIRGRYLNSLTYAGTGQIRGAQLNTGLLDVFITNTGQTRLGGHINLRKLDVNGSGYTEISGIKSQNLQISMSGKPHVKLVGTVRLSNLNLNGNGSLGLYWVKSDLLTIRARGKTFIQLGGVANKLDLELWGNSQFNGRYLRVKRLFAKTHDKSIAEISALDRQHTLATDASDIRFYEIPEMKADFMAYNGAVLDMRDWNNPAMEEYTRYNK